MLKKKVSFYYVSEGFDKAKKHEIAPRNSSEYLQGKEDLVLEGKRN